MKIITSEIIDTLDNIIYSLDDVVIVDAFENKDPDFSKPLVVVRSIRNSENDNYSTIEGERFSDIGFQINCYCRNQRIDGVITPAISAVSQLLIEVNESMSNAMGFARVGSPFHEPYPDDHTVMQFIARYEGILDLEEDDAGNNVIYKG